MLKQKTFKKAVSTTGVGLHSGEKVTLTLRPAEVDTGIIFRRVDLPNSPEIKVQAQAVRDTRLCSALEQDGARVSTVEHLMSAMAGLGVDNAVIEVDASEIPIVDGSAIPFIYLIQTAGVIEQSAAKRFIRVKKIVEVVHQDKWVRLEPHNGFKIDFTIDFPHPAFEHTGKNVKIDFADNTYVKEISRARTFGFMHEVEYLRANGLARGGSLDNAIVLDDYQIINPDGLRYEDEFAKHKVLDAIGDLYMLGHPLLCSFTAYKSGHALNNELLLTLLADEATWEYVNVDANDVTMQSFTIASPLN